MTGECLLLLLLRHYTALQCATLCSPSRTEACRTQPRRNEAGAAFGDLNLKFFKPSTKRAAILVAIEPAELTDVRDEIDTKYEAIYLSIYDTYSASSEVQPKRRN